jgi:hypothetical protein
MIVFLILKRFGKTPKARALDADEIDFDHKFPVKLQSPLPPPPSTVVQDEVAA